jgi:hypothetical protein
MSSPPRNRHRELIELAALFVAAGLTDVFTDVLGHRTEGPSILIALGVVVAAVSLARHRPARRGRAAAGSARGASTFCDRVGFTESSGRLWLIRTTVEDTPGRLAVLAGAFAAAGANILTLQVHPVADAVVDEFLVRAAADVTPQRLGAAVAAVGGGHVHVEGADVTALADAPTRALSLARRLVESPDHLGRVLVELLGAADVTWHPCDDAAASAGHGESGTESIAIAVSKPRPGVLVVSRPRMPFTLVEFARAQAMADLTGALHPSPGETPSRSQSER